MKRRSTDRIWHLVLIATLAIGGFVIAGQWAGCAHMPTPSPNMQQYERAFTQCLEQQGMADAADEGPRIWQILDSGGGFAVDLVTKIENLAASIGGQGVQLVTSCAVQAWLYVNPVTPGVQPSRPQQAARLYQARHVRRPTAKPATP